MTECVENFIQVSANYSVSCNKLRVIFLKIFEGSLCDSESWKEGGGDSHTWPDGNARRNFQGLKLWIR